MKCPKCGAESTIIICDWKDGFTHYCCFHPSRNKLAKVFVLGIEHGCGKYLCLVDRPGELFEKKPLDPWDAPVDTRGYPSSELP